MLSMIDRGPGTPRPETDPDGEPARSTKGEMDVGTDEVVSKTSEPLPSQRDLFDLPAGVTFLNCAYIAPPLRAVIRAGRDAVHRSKRLWELHADEWFAGPEALRAAAAPLMGADADGVALVPAASYGIAIAAANVPVERGQNIVVLDEQFPSNVYAWRTLARARDAEIRTARKEPSDAWTDAVLDAIDDDTGVVAVPNGHWTDGALVDLIRVAERARAVEAALVVDASQSIGAYPTDVAAIRPDFLVTVGYKWQLGPYGLGYLYADPKYRETGVPIERSWMTRAGAEDFAGLVDYVDAYRPGARRFDMGEYPQFVLLPMALAALRQLLEWGVERVQASLARLTDRIGTEAREMGLSALPSHERMGHMIGVRFPDGIPDALPGRLADTRIHVSVRGDSIRVAPHVHNDEDDIARLLSVLREFA